MDGKPELARPRTEDDEVGAVSGIWMIRTRVLCVVPEGITAVAHVHGWSVPPVGANSAGIYVQLPKKEAGGAEGEVRAIPSARDVPIPRAPTGT